MGYVQLEKNLVYCQRVQQEILYYLATIYIYVKGMAATNLVTHGCFIYFFLICSVYVYETVNVYLYE